MNYPPQQGGDCPDQAISGNKTIFVEPAYFNQDDRAQQFSPTKPIEPWPTHNSVKKTGDVNFRA
jgi:hypothetical protein